MAFSTARKPLLARHSLAATLLPLAGISLFGSLVSAQAILTVPARLPVIGATIPHAPTYIKGDPFAGKHHPAAPGWGPGTLVAHGHTEGIIAHPWANQSVIKADGNNLSPKALSMGYWDIIYRWKGASSPPNQKYMIVAATAVTSLATGRSKGWQDIALPFMAKRPGAPYPPATVGNRYRFRPNPDFCSGDLPTTLEHDSKGYLLRAKSYPIFGEVWQDNVKEPWSGEVTTEIRYTQPFVPILKPWPHHHPLLPSARPRPAAQPPAPPTGIAGIKHWFSGLLGGSAK